MTPKQWLSEKVLNKQYDHNSNMINMINSVMIIITKGRGRISYHTSVPFPCSPQRRKFWKETIISNSGFWMKVTFGPSPQKEIMQNQNVIFMQHIDLFCDKRRCWIVMLIKYFVMQWFCLIDLEQRCRRSRRFSGKHRLPHVFLLDI